MSQPSVTAYFNARKRQAPEELRSKAKVLLLERNQSSSVSNIASERSLEGTRTLEQSLPTVNEGDGDDKSPKVLFVSTEDAESKSSSSEGESCKPSVASPNRVARNIQLDSPKLNAQKASKMTPRSRTPRARKLSTAGEGQTDIRETFLKLSGESSQGTQKFVPFQKKGPLSPMKKASKRLDSPPKIIEKSSNVIKEQPAAGSITPKKVSLMDRLNKCESMGLEEIKDKLNKSSKLAEMKARIARIRKGEADLARLQDKEEGVKRPQIRKFEKIHLEVPVSPQKTNLSPCKDFLSPTKNVDVPKYASPQRRLLLEPKEIPASPIKGSPSKLPAHQRYQSLADSGVPALPLPYNYRLLAETFRCVDTVSAMLYNRKETITFKKLKPSVQELLRRNFTLEHLAQIKTIYPKAFEYRQEKHRTFGSSSKQDKYELVVSPIVEARNGRNTPDAEDVLKSASERSMSPAILLERRRNFYKALLERVKVEHEKFLLSLEQPMIIPRNKITRWHPEFNVEDCKSIEQAELPQAPNVEKISAKDVLDKAKTLFKCNTRMETALKRLIDAKMTTKSESQLSETTTSLTSDASTQVVDDNIPKVEISVVDTPPATPTAHTSYLSTAFKGIPKALLEKVRAKQAAKALEAMTRSPNAEKEAATYARLPELAKVLRNIFVAEKKGVLPMEFVIEKLDNSFRTKLTPNEIEEHIKLLSKLLPTWTSVFNARNTNHLKLMRDIDLAKVIKRLEIMANDKVKG